MRNVLTLVIICLFNLPALASGTAGENNPQEQHKPTYMECFKLSMAKLVNENEKNNQQIKQQIKQGELSATVEHEKFDIQKYNPKIKPKSLDAKTSLEIDLPDYKNKKIGTDNNSPYNCKTLYGLHSN